MEYNDFEYTIHWKDEDGKEASFPGATRDIFDFDLIKRYFRVLTKKHPQRFMWIVAEPNFIDTRGVPIWGTETYPGWYDFIIKLEKEAEKIENGI